jgi:glycosyltransferase involved in cell wall biosynthesis
MPEFYAALDIYICASRWEGFNLPIVEAAWHGVPAVAYDAGAHGEHVTAMIVPHGDFDSLCRAALTLVRELDLRRKLSTEVRDKAQQFTWDRATDQFNAVLGEAVS